MIKTEFLLVPEVITEEYIKDEAEGISASIMKNNADYIKSLINKKHRPSAFKSLAAMGILGAFAEELGIFPTIAKTENGKPYFSDIPYIDFSISHSENLVACSVCISKKQKPVIGIDCEAIYKKDPMPLSERFFTKNEIETIASSDDKAKEFTKLWTKKEAYLKLLGKGLSVSLSSFDVGSLPYHFETYEIMDNIFTICSEKSLF